MSDIGILLTGQSLALGGHDDPHTYTDLQTPSATGRCYMLGAQPVGRGTETLSGVVSLLAEDEMPTIGHSLTHNIATEQTEDRVFFHGQAYGGLAYANLKKGAAYGVYEKIMAQADNLISAYPNVKYDCVCVIHGEQDGNDNNHFYYNDMAEWLAEFNADVKALTGQTSDLFLIQSQVSSSCGYGFNDGIVSTEFPTALSQLKAHEKYDGVVLACPKYFIGYVDHAHTTDIAQRILGEYYYKAYKAYKAHGVYNPLKPIKIYGSGNHVYIRFVGAVGGLTFDTTLVQAVTNYGFDYRDQAGNTIESVALGDNEVILTLSGDVGGNPWVSYAYQNGSTGDANQAAGLGERGNLRDNDTATSLYDSARLYNWCVTFKKPCGDKNTRVITR